MVVRPNSWGTRGVPRTIPERAPPPKREGKNPRQWIQKAAGESPPSPKGGAAREGRLSEAIVNTLARVAWQPSSPNFLGQREEADVRGNSKLPGGQAACDPAGGKLY